VSDDASLGVDPPCLIEQLGRRVNPDDSTPAPGETASHGSGPGTNIDNVLARETDSHLTEAVEQRSWKPRAMEGVVLGGSTEINAHTVTLRVAAKCQASVHVAQCKGRTGRIGDGVEMTRIRDI